MREVAKPQVLTEGEKKVLIIKRQQMFVKNLSLSLANARQLPRQREPRENTNP